MRILQLCHPADVGGLERVVQGLALGLGRFGHEVQVAAIYSPGADASAFVSPLVAAGVRVRRLDIAPGDYFGELRQVRAVLEDFRPDIVHTHGYRADLLHGAFTRRRTRAALVSTLHGFSRMGGVSSLFEWLQERTIRRFDAVIAVSAPLFARLRTLGVPDEVLHLRPNALVDDGASSRTREAARQELGLAGDTFAFGWVGRLFAIKGPDILIRALAAPGLESARTVLIGDGPERGTLHALVQTLRLADRVTFAGARPDARALMPAFDAFVLSSRSEGTPMVVLEAMQAALPVVATDVGGVAELLGGVGKQWLVPAEAPERLGAALRDVLSDHDARRAAGSAASVRARECYSFERWVAEHVAIYAQAMAHRSHRGGGW